MTGIPQKSSKIIFFEEALLAQEGIIGGKGRSVLTPFIHISREPDGFS
jgi:hypothetical protein